MSRTVPPISVESSISEIVIQPDGRVFVFGLSQPLLELLAALQPHDQRVARRLQASRDNARTGGGE